MSFFINKVPANTAVIRAIKIANFLFYIIFKLKNNQIKINCKSLKVYITLYNELYFRMYMLYYSV
jgi:hypothetical protein